MKHGVLLTLVTVACSAPLRTSRPPPASPPVEAHPVERASPPIEDAERTRGELAAILAEQDWPAGRPRGEFVWPSRDGRDDLLVALGRTSLLWARCRGRPRGGSDSIHDGDAIADVVPRFGVLDLNGDGEAELLLFEHRPDGGDEVVAWTRSAPLREPTQLQRASWLLAGARTLVEVGERAATLTHFAAPTDASPTEDMVLRLQTATAAELRAIASPRGVTFCKVDQSRMARGPRRRCWSLRLGALPDADVRTVVLTFGVRPARTPRPSSDDSTEPPWPFAPLVWFEDPLIGDAPDLEGIAARLVSPPRPTCETRGAVHRCRVRVRDDEFIVPQFEWVFTGGGSARRLAGMTLTLRDYRGE